MANLIRSAKSGNDWTLNDLESYHISLNQENPLQFFDVQVRIDPTLEILTTFHVTGIATSRS